MVAGRIAGVRGRKLWKARALGGARLLRRTLLERPLSGQSLVVTTEQPPFKIRLRRNAPFGYHLYKSVPQDHDALD